MIELAPKGVWSWDFDIANDGRTIGTIELQRIRFGGTITIGETTYEMSRRGFLGAFELKQAGRVVATATRSSIFPPRFDVQADDRLLQLRMVGLLPKTAKLSHGDVDVAEIRRKRMFQRNVSIDVADAATPPHLILFAVAVIVLYWRHLARSSS